MKLRMFKGHVAKVTPPSYRMIIQLSGDDDRLANWTK